MPRFLAEGSVCGRDLLSLVARGSAIIAELLRLSENIPAAVLPGAERDPQLAKYKAILFDFRYKRTPERFDDMVNHSVELSEINEEFVTTHEAVLLRFYTLFDSIYRYVADYRTFLDDLSAGKYVENSVDTVMLDVDGKRLMCEALYLWGVMLLFMDIKFPGHIREPLIIAHFRHKGEGLVANIDEVIKLCRGTGFIVGAPPEKRPPNYPEEMFARFPIPEVIVMKIIDRLRSDDIYDLTRVFPDPDHRSSALSQQASILYVALFFVPGILHEAKAMMREIVDKHYNDNWVLPVYMGHMADLSEEWAPYRAAREALAMDCLQLKTVKTMVARHKACIGAGHRDIDGYLTEGVLTDRYIVDHVEDILKCMRRCNVTLRWMLLHRRTTHRKFREIIIAELPNNTDILNFLLKNAQFEFKLKAHFQKLLRSKREKWDAIKSTTSTMLLDLSNFFSGEMPLVRVERDEHMMMWFAGLSTKVEGLDFDRPMLAGRTIQAITKALEDCESFDAIATSQPAKSFLLSVREQFTNMIRTVNVNDEVMGNIDTISDLSYAWEILNDFLPDMHQRIRSDPSSVVLLRAMFLKLTSVLDFPLARIVQAGSRDQESVAQHYSSELVAFVRRALEAVPVIMFEILRAIMAQQVKIRALPTKLELASLKDFAQLDERSLLARYTYNVSVFTEGILAMETTLLGVIQVDPRQILNDGIRKHLVRQIAEALHSTLIFDFKSTANRKDPKGAIEAQLLRLTQVLESFKVSFEYIQDYIGIYGLKMWQEEYSRILGYNAEQECNRYLKRKVLPKDSKYHSRAIPVPVYAPVDDGALTFMGRLFNAVMFLTDPKKTIFSSSCSGWFDVTGREIAGQGFFKLLMSSVGVYGLTGLDRLLAFRATHNLTNLIRFYGAQTSAGVSDMLYAAAADLSPLSHTPPKGLDIYNALIQRLKKPIIELISLLLEIGQVQILRREICNQLRFACRLDSSLLYGSLHNLNEAVLNDIRKHYADAEKYPYPADDNPLLSELSKYLEATGQHDPLSKVYITCDAQPHIALWLSVAIMQQMHRFTYDRDFGSLIRSKTTYEMDGAPLMIGLATLLKQLHPSVTRQVLAFLSQYVRLQIAASFVSGGRLNADVVNTLLFVRQLGGVMAIPHVILEKFIPNYILEAAVISA